MGNPNSSDSHLLCAQTDRLLTAFKERYRHSTLGALIKGIIHNFNGSLQVLSLQMELLQSNLLKEDEGVSPSIQTKISQCRQQMDRLKDMVEVLIQKGIHDEAESFQHIQLNDLLEEELALLHHNLFVKHHVRVVKSFSPKLPLLKGYYLDFSQGMINLMQNAVEAMETSPTRELQVATAVGDGQIRVTIQDTGCGITEEIRPHLFEPFYTNKGGKHYGLGLFMARDLLSPYGAAITYNSRQGETTFTVHFSIVGAQRH
jgi:signal transduction histidine kinase